MFYFQVGRQAASKLVTDIIRVEKLNKELLVEIMGVFENFFPNVDQLTEEVVHLVREMRIVEVERHMPPTQDQQFRVS